jgi:uncharacterized protein (DUF2252 family)
MAPSVAQTILDDNRGREPGRLRRKFRLLRADPFAFYRGTCHLFYDSLPRSAVLAAAPPLLVCGDLHLENFGAYRGDNRLAYFDLNDFDEAALALFTLDLLRFVSSIHVAASYLRLSTRQAGGSAAFFSTATGSGSWTARPAGSSARRHEAWCVTCWAASSSARVASC